MAAKSNLATTVQLPAHLRTLPGMPLPRGANARQKDIRQRMRDWNAMEPVATAFYHEVAGDLTAQAGAALAVVFANNWVDLVLEVEPPDEREKLQGAMWRAPLSMTRHDYPTWVALTAHLCVAAAQLNGAGAAQIIMECRMAWRAMRSVATGQYDGQLHRYDDVVVSAMRGVRDAAGWSGFALDDMAKFGPMANIEISMVERANPVGNAETGA